MAKCFSMKKTVTMLLAIIFMVASLCTTISFAAEPTNYVENGSFVPGSGGQWGAIPGWTPSIAVGSMDLYLGDWSYGNPAYLPDGIYLALRKEANPGSAALSVTQTITNLPAGIYKLSAWMWAQNNVGTFTITISDGTNTKTLSAIPSEKGYKETEVAISSNSATITITADNENKSTFMDALVDDVKLVKVRDIDPSTSVNYIENGSFTPGDNGQWGVISDWTPSIPVGSMDLYLGNWTYSNPAVFPDEFYLALRKETNPGAAAVSVSQTINNLPEGVYKLSAWVWAINNVGTCTITISDGTNEVSITTAPTEIGYKNAEIEITSGSATVTITADNADKTAAMDALVDDVKLVKVRDIGVVLPTNYIENGTFTPGAGGQWGEIPGWTPSIAVGSMDLYLGDWPYGNAANLPDGIYLALRKEANPNSAPLSVTQTINNLPEGVYKLSAWMWAQNNVGTFTITISDGTNETTLTAAAAEKGYKDAEIEITSGSATITITADNATKTTFMDALVDDMKLIKIGEIENTPTPPNTPNTPTGDVAIFAIAFVMMTACTAFVSVSKKRRGWNA